MISGESCSGFLSLISAPVAFGFGLQQLLQPLPVGETGVASCKGLLGRPSKAMACSRGGPRETAFGFLRRKLLAVREGGALSLGGGSRAPGFRRQAGERRVRNRNRMAERQKQRGSTEHARPRSDHLDR
jgi:hypothetical protein